MSIISVLAGELQRAKVFENLADSDSSTFVASESALAWILVNFRTDRAALTDRSRIVMVLPSQAEVADLFEALLSLNLGIDITVVPPWETLPFERVSPRVEAMGKRVAALWNLSQARQDPNKIFLFSARSYAQRFDRELLEYVPLFFSPALNLDLDTISKVLYEFGYDRVYQVEAAGEFSIRGSILDIFPADRDTPIRIDFFGDEVETIKEFSLTDQRSGKALDTVTVHPARELRPIEGIRNEAITLSSAIPKLSHVFERFTRGEFFEGMESWGPFFTRFSSSVSSLLSSNDILVLRDKNRIDDRITTLLDEERALLELLAPTWELALDEDIYVSLFNRLDDQVLMTKPKVLNLDSVAKSSDIMRVDLEPYVLSDFREETIIGSLRSDVRSGFRVIITADSPSMANRMITSIKQAGLGAIAIKDSDELLRFLSGTKDYAGKVGCVVSDIEVGFRSINAKLVIAAPFDLTGRRLRRVRSSNISRRAGQALYESLRVGGYVVHDFHGVGKYLGMTRREVSGVERDYLEIEYRDGAKLFLPTDQLSVITPYSGGEKPTLSRLGGSEWNKTKARVKKTVERIAQELVLLYQKQYSQINK